MCGYTGDPPEQTSWAGPGPWLHCSPYGSPLPQGRDHVHFQLSSLQVNQGHCSSVYPMYIVQSQVVFRIPYIFRRVRILGSGHLITDLDPAFIFSGIQDANKKNLSSLFLFITVPFEGTFTSVFKNIKSRNQGFSKYFCLLMEGFGS